MTPRQKNKNLFLNSLSDDNRELLLCRSVPVSLPVPTDLFRADEVPQYAYFMSSGMASVVTEMVDGGSAEVGMLGREGIVGALHVLGPSTSPAHCFMQLDGEGLRIPLSDLRSLFQSSDEIRERVLKLVQKEAMVLSQIAGCHRLHGAEERLARWLLMAQDQTQTDVLEFTQEFLANMLGSRRATVTVVAGTLQRAGLIEHQRKSVRVLDRERLEAAACDCYRVIKEIRGDVYRMG